MAFDGFNTHIGSTYYPTQLPPNERQWVSRKSPNDVSWKGRDMQARNINTHCRPDHDLDDLPHIVRV